MKRSRMYTRDTSRIRQSVHLVWSIAKTICKSKFLSSVVFFLVHLPQISIILDIRKVDLVIQKKLNAIVAVFRQKIFQNQSPLKCAHILRRQYTVVPARLAAEQSETKFGCQPTSNVLIIQHALVCLSIHLACISLHYITLYHILY